MFCSLFVGVLVHAAGCDKDSLVHRCLCDKLHSHQSQLLLARPAVIEW